MCLKMEFFGLERIKQENPLLTDYRKVGVRWPGCFSLPLTMLQRVEMCESSEPTLWVWDGIWLKSSGKQRWLSNLRVERGTWHQWNSRSLLQMHLLKESVGNLLVLLLAWQQTALLTGKPTLKVCLEVHHWWGRTKKVKKWGRPVGSQVLQTIILCC